MTTIRGLFSHIFRDLSKSLLPILLLAVLASIPISVHAMEFQCKDARFISPDDGYVVGNQSVRFFSASGPVETGDANRLEHFLDNCPFSGFGMYIMELDSTGGSFEEAVEIGLYVRSRGIGTYVGADRQCLSACAVIFMAGHEHVGDGDFFPRRRMHPHAILGFHAPFIMEGLFDRLPDEALRTVPYAMYRSAISAASRLLVLAIEADWSPSLVQRILETPQDHFFYVDSVDLAGRWQISVELDPTLRRSIYSDRDLAQACINFSRWAGDTVLRDHMLNWDSVYDTSGIDGLLEVMQREPYQHGGEAISFREDMGIECGFIDTGDRIIESHEFSINSGWRAIPFEYSVLPGLTKLTDASVLIRTALSDTIRKDTKTLIYDHNGSKMTAVLTPAGDSTTRIEIRYDVPKDSLRRSGVQSGALLVDGVILNGRVSAATRLFSRKCGEAIFPVYGDFQEDAKEFVLKGSATVRDSECRILPHKQNNSNDVLIFIRSRE